MINKHNLVLQISCPSEIVSFRSSLGVIFIDEIEVCGLKDSRKDEYCKLYIQYCVACEHEKWLKIHSFP